MLVDKLFFVFEEAKLFHRQPRATFNLDEQMFRVDPVEGQSRDFSITDANQTSKLTFRADNCQLKEAWLAKLSLQLAASCGVRYRLTRWAAAPNYWKVLRV